MVNNETVLINEFKKTIPGLKLFVGEPMSKHTTFRIGGPADYFVMPSSMEDVASVLKIAKKNNVAVTILGNGSNVLVLDKGIRGLVLKIGHSMNHIIQNGDVITVGAGTMLTAVSRYAANKQLTGMEFATGIPGSIGGAVYMNAGAYDGEMSLVVSSVLAVCYDGLIKKFDTSEISFGYRHSIFQNNNSVICEVEISLEKGDKNIIEAKMNDYTSRRITKQPIEMPSAGSTFKRPNGHFAGTLIEQSGLKGYKVGGAQISEKHAGFIVNIGGATANDVLCLIDDVKDHVYERFGVKLQPEVRILGEK